MFFKTTLRPGDPLKYHGLAMSPEARSLLLRDPATFASYCNGVGSCEGGWFRRLVYRITPDTIWGLDITPCSDVHDVEYSIKRVFATRDEALAKREEIDDRFRANLDMFVLRETSWWWLIKLRLSRVEKYRFMLREFGEESFLAENKIINQE